MTHPDEGPETADERDRLDAEWVEAYRNRAKLVGMSTTEGGIPPLWTVDPQTNHFRIATPEEEAALRRLSARGWPGSHRPLATTLARLLATLDAARTPRETPDPQEGSQP